MPASRSASSPTSSPLSSKNKVSRQKAPDSSSSGDLSELENILQLMARHEVAELEWERGETRILLKTKAAFVPTGTVAVAASAAPIGAPATLAFPAPATGPAHGPSNGSGATASAGVDAKASAARGQQIVSPFVGTFYRAPSPNAEPYVKEGQVIRKGDPLCIIEAMKLMNEIESEYSGKILEVLVENGQPVEFGEPLFLIEP